ncbi:MAG: HU family DNA-binding protein [Fibrobacterales bacterium]
MSNVTKKDIVEEIAMRTGMTQVDTKIVIECFLDSIANAMVGRNNIEIRGFGRFKIKEKKARIARNPRTGEPVQVEAGVKPVFEASKDLKKYLNENVVGLDLEDGAE